MTSTSINDNPKMLYNQILRKKGEDNIRQIPIPNFVISNLNPSFSLRPYQEEAFRQFFCYMDNDFDFKEKHIHLLFNMATGSGKTLLMAGMIIDLYKRGYRDFLFFSTSNTIIDKTKKNFTDSMDSKYLFANQIIVDNIIVPIITVNSFEESRDDCINICFTTIHKLHFDLQTDKENSITFDSFKDKHIVLIGDEAHHFNKQTQEELFLNDKNWEATIQKILQSNSKNILLEYTATIDWEHKAMRDKYMPKTLSKYDLINFRNDGYSKEIYLFQSDKGASERDLMLQAVILNQYKQDLAKKHNISLKPVILFKAQKTIQESYNNQEEFNKLILELKPEDIINLRNLYLKSNDKDLITENLLDKVFSFYNKNDNNFTGLLQNIKINFAPTKCLNVNDKKQEDIISKKNISKSENKELFEIQTQEKILNSLEDYINEYRVIFAVNKLNEGWDVLNLYDIVRLYDTRDADNNKAGKGTIAEAQLIGRGARYYPFLYNGSKDNYRRFDSDIQNEMAILERLHYHTKHNVKYIQELRNELIKQGLMDEKTITCRLEVKPEMKQMDFFKNGVVFANEQMKKTYKSSTWDELSIVKTSLLYRIYSGQTKERDVFIEGKDNFNKKIDNINYKISEIDNHIKKQALLTYPFFSFNNLSKYILDITCIQDFIDKKLNNLKIALSGIKSDLYPVSNENKYKIMQKLLYQIKNELSDNISELEGSKEFKHKQLKDIFKDKELHIQPDTERSKGDKEFLCDKNWYIYNANYGTSEEKAFVKMFDRIVKELEEDYTDIRLIRNEQELPIFDFKKGRPFYPDFILIMKKKEPEEVLNYQLFIEPKGEYLENNDKWKSEFLEEMMSNGKKDIIEFHVEKYKILGVPFYNKSSEIKFEEQLKTALS